MFAIMRQKTGEWYAGTADFQAVFTTEERAISLFDSEDAAVPRCEGLREKMDESFEIIPVVVKDKQ